MSSSGACNTRRLLDQSSPFFIRRRGVIDGVNACIRVAILQSITELQRTQWTQGNANFPDSRQKWVTIATSPEPTKSQTLKISYKLAQRICLWAGAFILRKIYCFFRGTPHPCTDGDEIWREVVDRGEDDLRLTFPRQFSPLSVQQIAHQDEKLQNHLWVIFNTDVSRMHSCPHVQPF